MDFVAKLNEFKQKTGSVVTYEEGDCAGPDHMRTFSIKAVVNGKPYPEGVGKTKKEAKKNAAKNAYDALIKESPNSTGDEEFSGASRQDETSKHDVADICDMTTGLTLDKKRDFKGIINHYCQKKKLSHTYINTTSGPPHNPQFFVRLVIGDKKYPEGVAKTLKEAEQKAAQLAWEAFQEQSDWDSKVSIKSTESETGGPLNTDSSAAQNSHEASQLQPDAAKDKNMRNGQNETSTQSRFLTDFKPLECLGRGAFGLVCKARHKVLNKDYAVKIVRCDKKSFKEVVALSDMQHENIIRYYNCWMENTGYEMYLTDDSYSYSQSSDRSSATYLYIHMELCAKTLRVWINEKNSQNPQVSEREDESLGIVQQIVTGVEYIHSQKQIHRDLKPENIMFGLDGKVKIGDFGLVTRDDMGYPLMERTDERGTPTYMAPEQYEKNYNRKVDIFALGLIFFELLWKVSTGHERVKVMQDARYQMLPKEFSQTFFPENRVIVMMLSARPKDRPEASTLKAELRKLNSERDSLREHLTV